MRKILNLFIISLIAFSCGSNGNLKKSKGELVGVKGKKYYSEKPFGMVLIPGGSFIMGKSDDDIASIQDAPPKTVTVRSFYMDETEITNSEYRQFVNWVRDSVIRTQLAIKAEDLIESGASLENNAGILKYAFIDSDTTDLSVYDKWKLENEYYESNEDYYASRKLNWREDLIFDRDDYPDEEYLEVIESFYLPKEKVFNEVEKAWDVKKFIFRHKFSNISGNEGYIYRKNAYKMEKIRDVFNMEQGWEEITEPGGVTTFKNIDNDSIFVMDDDWFASESEGDLSREKFAKEVPVLVYPDTTVWELDFQHSENQPMHANYFSHDAFSDYPVVGVSFHQAKAFCNWRTFTKNSYQKTKKKKSRVPNFRLPTEAEWEYAARGGLQSAMYPWGGPYTKDDRGCFMANFKPMRGDYTVDQALYTVEADAYEPNGYNLYNMSGNVAEWVDSSYEPEAYEFTITMNPNINKSDNNKKVIRGGSWKDVKYFLQVSSRDYEYADQARSYIGFRTVHDYLGSDMTANAMTNAATRKRNNRRSSIK